MQRLVGILILLGIAALPSGATAQAVSADSVRMEALGAEAGLTAGQVASVNGARWGSAAATFFLTPFVGGVGSVLTAHLTKGAPSTVPEVSMEATHPVYQQAYIDAYQSAYRPRYRRAVHKAVLFTSILFFAGAAVFAG